MRIVYETDNFVHRTTHIGAAPRLAVIRDVGVTFNVLMREIGVDNVVTEKEELARDIDRAYDLVFEWIEGA